MHPSAPVSRNASTDTPLSFWRSLEELNGDAEFRQALENEFPAGATAWPLGMSRRHFIELMGASLALAGFSGCNRLPRKVMAPYVDPPENVIPGIPAYYTSAMAIEGYGRGILVESHLGRPTKIEGNPDHPESLGATDAVTQAAVLSVYEPDRSRAPLKRNLPQSWRAFEEDWTTLFNEFASTQGAGLTLITEPTTSPTTLRVIHAVLDRFPQAQWYQHTALGRYDFEGVQPDYDFAQADVIFSIGSDFLYQHPAALRYCRAFTQRRRVVDGKVSANRFYAVESTPSVTGSMADHRLAASPQRTTVLLNAIAQALGVNEGGAPAIDLTAGEKQFVSALARDLREHAPKIVCVAGPEADAAVQRWALALNVHLGAQGQTLRALPLHRSDADPRCNGDLAAFHAAAARGGVHCVVIAGSNPAYTAPVDLKIADTLKRIPRSFHIGQHLDETGVLCEWHLPESNFLEAWGDLIGYEGTAAIQQPLIEPLYSTRSAAELLWFIAQSSWMDGYDLVRTTWKPTLTSSGEDFDEAWTQRLNHGTLTTPVASPPAVWTSQLENALAIAGAGNAQVDTAVTVLLRADATISDGRWANNAWLQELPKPLTRLVWDNAALISPAFAEKEGLSNGDVILLMQGQWAVEAPVWIAPGQSATCVTLPLGYGRTHAGTVGHGLGFDAYRLRSTQSPWTIENVTFKKTGKTLALVTTQHHFAMEQREVVKIIPVADLKNERGQNAPLPSLYPSQPPSGHAWAMSIDLSTCTGCNACVVACQSENNIPVVGKDQVARGREMHWIRVDRYFQGDLHAPQIVHQPVPCMQCENAPCELVCPVGATVHSTEGLNDMVYNRCVGTRYCSNNCPYKVRRFNFFDFRTAEGSPENLQKNPDVSVRDRGVMEKCTYCVQRINTARIIAEREKRPLRDGEIKTACEQVCPAAAIVFGDLLDRSSRVVQRKAEKTDYSLLADLNTRPRTTYLAKVINPAIKEATIPS